MSYDVFLSHSHVDKDWTRALHDAISRVEYFGRALRVWLDARVLDPGNLSSARELESALERSRRLILVLSDEALASDWVRHEIDFFLGVRSSSDILLLRLRSCAIPAQLADCQLIDWAEKENEQAQMRPVLAFLTPSEDNESDYRHRHTTRRMLGNAIYQLPRAYDPQPTEASHKMLEQLTSFDIGNLDQEGLALAGFETAAQFIAELDATESYSMRMVMGEILALCMLQNRAYAQVARIYVANDKNNESAPSFLTMRNRTLRGKTSVASTTNLLFSVARSASKLAAIDVSRVDLSTLAALLLSLDKHEQRDEQREILARMMARVLGKLRGNPVVELLLHVLVEWGGNASHLTAAGAIAISFEGVLDTDDFYTQELVELTGKLKLPLVPPPSPALGRLLFEPYSGLGTDADLVNEVRSCRGEYIRNFGQPPSGKSPQPESAPVVTSLVNGPIVGRITLVTLANMESLADQLGSADIACLTEPRIVDALFEHAGAFLIDDSELDAPLGNRLHRRGVRYASFATSTLRGFEDGRALVLWPSIKGRPSAGLIV